MMLYPPLSKLVDKVGSRYLLVNVVARRARQISQYAEENDVYLEEKPVSEAINEIFDNKLHVTDLSDDKEAVASDDMISLDSTNIDDVTVDAGSSKEYNSFLSE